MDKESLIESQKAYILRTREAREWAKRTRTEVAGKLGISEKTYANYEVPERNRPMPQEYISKFCEFIGVNERWLISNKGKREADYVEKLEALVKERIATLQSVISSEAQ